MDDRWRLDSAIAGALDEPTHEFSTRLLACVILPSLLFVAALAAALWRTSSRIVGSFKVVEASTGTNGDVPLAPVDEPAVATVPRTSY